MNMRANKIEVAKRLFATLSLLCCLTVGVIAVAPTRPINSQDKVVRAPAIPSTPMALTLPITLRQGGFVSQEITKPEGDYYISVNNLSGVQELRLRLARENGNRLHEVKVTGRKRNWRQYIHLTPGTYLLTEAGHPDWVCRIIITPK